MGNFLKSVLTIVIVTALSSLPVLAGEAGKINRVEVTPEQKQKII